MIFSLDISIDCLFELKSFPTITRLSTNSCESKPKYSIYLIISHLSNWKLIITENLCRAYPVNADALPMLIVCLF